MIRIDDTHFVCNGAVYIVKRLKPTKYGYHITNKEGKRIWVTQAKIDKYENDMKEKLKNETNNIQNQ